MGKLKDLIKLGKKPLPLPQTSEQAAQSPGDDARPQAEGEGGESPTPISFSAGVAAPALDDDTESGRGNEEVAGKSLAYQDLWKEAYETVVADPEYTDLLVSFETYIQGGKDATLDLTLDSKSTTIEDAAERQKKIQEAAIQRLAELPNAQLSFSIGGRSIVVREAVRKAVKTVNSFKDLIGTAMSAEPHACIAWAGIMTILPLLETSLQQNDDAAEGLNNIIFLLIRYRELQEGILSNKLRDASHTESSRPLLESIRTKIVSIFAQVYVYQVHFVLQYARKRVQRFLRDAVSADGWNDMWTSIELTSDLVEKGVQSRMASISLGTWRTTNEILEQVGEIQSFQRTIHASIQDGNQTSLLLRLECAANALFDSNEISRAEAGCLEGTQLRILNQIQDWAEDPTEPPILWLGGMAGTGKTSVAVTVADALSKQQSFSGDDRAAPRGAFLGASFFFKRDDATRNNTHSLFTTIASCLAQEFPDLKVHITDAVKNNLNIGTASHEKQFRDLIGKPLSLLDQQTFLPLRLIIIIDALDECVAPDEVEVLLSTLKGIGDLRQLQLRFLITSRPDQHIINEFNDLPDALYRFVPLEKIQRPIKAIDEKDDITLYLKHTLRSISKKMRVRGDWIDDDGIAKLSQKADGLFIYAATICRFLKTPDLADDECRKELLDLIFDDANEDDAPQQKVDEMYLKVLRFSRLDKSTKMARRRFLADIEKILGYIAVFFEPVSMPVLANFVQLEKQKLEAKLGDLRSVVHVPEDEDLPLSLVHLSFRDFLLSKERSGGLPFRVEESSMHSTVLERCLTIMSEKLHQNMCNLALPGHLVSEIPTSQIETNISASLQYACTYWVNHLAELDEDQRMGQGLKDDGKLDDFIRKKILFWLETMSLTGRSSTAVLSVNRLETLINASRDPGLSRLIHDARRFIMTNRWVIEHAPLQIYCSALLFSPLKSEIRLQFENFIPDWITLKPSVDEQWTSEFSALQGHKDFVTSVACSPCSNLIVSGSDDRTTRIWDYTTGVELYEFDEPGTICSVAFSPDGRLVASAGDEGIIRIREFAKGTVRVLTGHSDSVTGIAFSPKNPNIVASIGRDDSFRVWNITEVCESHIFDLPETYMGVVAFGPNGEFVAAGSGDIIGEGVVRLWGVEKGELRLVFRGHTRYPIAIAISMDGQTVVSGSSDGTALFWKAATGEVLRKCAFADTLGAIAFSPANRDLVALTVDDDVVEIRHMTSWDLVGSVRAIVSDCAFSHDGKFLAAPDGYYVRLLDTTIMQPQEGHQPVYKESIITSIRFFPGSDWILAESFQDQSSIWSPEVEVPELFRQFLTVTFSPDERLHAVATKGPNGERAVQVWQTGSERHSYEYDGFHKATFSPDSSRIALISPNKLCIVDCQSSMLVLATTLDVDSAEDVLFSPNAQRISWCAKGSQPHDGMFHIWDIAAGKELVRYRCDDYSKSITFSPDGSLVVFQAHQHIGRPVLLEAATGRVRGSLSDCTLTAIEFHPDGQLLATVSVSDPAIIRFWDMDSGETSFDLGMPDDDRQINDLSISTTDLLAVATTAVVHLWDLTTSCEIGRLCVDLGPYSSRGLSFSANFQYLVCDIGHLPLPPPVGTHGTATWPMSEEAGSCLHVERQWIFLGLDPIIWVPRAYRSPSVGVRGGLLVLGYRLSKVLIMKLDLNKTPLSTRHRRQEIEEVAVDA